MHLRPSPFCQFLGAPPPFYCPALALRVSQLSQGLQPPQLGKSGDAPGGTVQHPWPNLYLCQTVCLNLEETYSILILKVA